MLRHDDLLPFIQEEIFTRTWTMRVYYALNVLLLALSIWLAVVDVSKGEISWGMVFKNFGLGILLAISLLIPIHEGIHGLAYKMAGAPKVRYGVNWRKFYFYAVADKFVANRKAFLMVGSAPFAVVSAATVILIFFTPLQVKWFLLGVLFMHTGACAGDFAMLSYYERNRHFEDMLTYDDLDSGISWFYVKEK
jgi:hypothetical protein